MHRWLRPPAHRDHHLGVALGQIPDIWIGSVLNAKYAAPYAGPPRAKVLLPDGYDPSKKYPLLVLLAGASSNYRTWSYDELGRITTTAAGFGIIVMPGGRNGLYTDWWRGGPQWESYYVDVVIPEIMKRFPDSARTPMACDRGCVDGGLGRPISQADCRSSSVRPQSFPVSSTWIRFPAWRTWQRWCLSSMPSSCPT